MPVLHLVRIMPSYSRKTINRMHTKINIQFDCGRKHKAAISGCEASRKKFTGPKKGRFSLIDDAVFKFFPERRKTGLFVSYDLLRKEATKRVRSLNIFRSRFKASKGWAIRFMRRMGAGVATQDDHMPEAPKRF